MRPGENQSLCSDYVFILWKQRCSDESLSAPETFLSSLAYSTRLAIIFQGLPASAKVAFPTNVAVTHE